MTKPQLSTAVFFPLLLLLLYQIALMFPPLLFPVLWAALLVADSDQEANALRDPVAPATRSMAALTKVARHTLTDGTPAHSFSTLLAELATIVRNTCHIPMAGPHAPTFEVVTNPNSKQKRALDLIQQITLESETRSVISHELIAATGRVRSVIAGTSD
jgi:hypothetical protein